MQYGLLTDKISFNKTETVVDAEGNPVLDEAGNAKTQVVGDELSIDKNVIIADVTVNF